MTIERWNYPNGYFPKEEYEARWKKAHAAMKRKKYDLAVVFGKTGGHYERAMETLWLTQFFSERSGQEPDSPLWNAHAFCAVILEPGKVPELHGEMPEGKRRWVHCSKYVYSDDIIATTAKALRSKGYRRVAFVGSDCLPVKYFQQLQKQTPKIEYVFDDDLIRECRRIKSPRELEMYRECGRIVSSALYRLCDGLWSGKTGAEAAADAAHELTLRGASWLRTPINFGNDEESIYFERDNIPGYPNYAPEKGDFIRTWIYGPVHQGYWIDPGRSLVCGGKPSKAQRSLLEDSYAISQAVLDTVKHGVKVLDVARAANKVKKKVGAGYDHASQQWPYNGHGNGMMWEHPMICEGAVDEDEIFEEGMVGSAESFMTRDGVGSAGWEQNYIVTRKGIDLITTTPVFWF